MHHRIDHRIPADLEHVEATLLDPGFPASLGSTCPALAEGRLLERTARGDLVTPTARFRARPGWLGGAFAWLPTVAWVEHVEWSRAAHAGRFTISPCLPEVAARRVTCHGTYSLTPRADGGTRRCVEVFLSIRAPLVGRAAESRLVDLLNATFEAEASLLTRAGE